MPISPMDEYLAHQTSETFDHVATSDRNFYDRFYFNCFQVSGDMMFPARSVAPLSEAVYVSPYSSTSSGTSIAVRVVVS